MDLSPGERFPDLDLPDHTGRPRRLSELAGGTRSCSSPHAAGGVLGAELVCLSTFSLDASLCGGAVTVARTPELFADDPFARLFPATVVQTGIFCAVPAPAGPVIERYAGVPWPGGCF